MHRPLSSLFALALLIATAGGKDTVTVVVRTTLDEKPVAEAVVWATPLDHAPPPAAQDAVAEIEQINQEFQPYVTVVQTGSKVRFPNHDTVQHHVYSLSKPKRFEIPLYQSGTSETVSFETPGLITIGCNIHDWMVAYIRVVATPYFAKTDAQGTASLPPLPEGKYRLEIWHPRAVEAITREISSSPNDMTNLEFTVALKPEKRIRRAPGGKSSDY